MRTSPEKSYKTSAHSPAGSSFLRGGGGGGEGVEVAEVGEDSKAIRLTGGGANCFFWVPEDEGGKKDDGLAKGGLLFLAGFLTDVKNPLADDKSTSPPNFWRPNQRGNQCG